MLCFEDDDLHEILSNDDEIESLILEVVDKVLEYQSKFAEEFNELKDLLTSASSFLVFEQFFKRSLKPLKEIPSL